MSYDILTFHFEMNWGGIGRKEKKKKKDSNKCDRLYHKKRDLLLGESK